MSEYFLFQLSIMYKASPHPCCVILVKTRLKLYLDKNSSISVIIAQFLYNSFSLTSRYKAFAYLIDLHYIYNNFHYFKSGGRKWSIKYKKSINCNTFYIYFINIYNPGMFLRMSFKF